MGWIKIHYPPDRVIPPVKLIHPGEIGPPGWEFWYTTRVEIGSYIEGQRGGNRQGDRVDMSDASSEPMFSEMDVWKEKR